MAQNYSTVMQNNIDWMSNARICYWPTSGPTGAGDKRFDLEITPLEVDRVAKSLAKKNVNVVMLNHRHLRFNYTGIFKEIEDATRIVADACHSYGMKLIEHHSSTVTSNRGFYKGKRILDWANRDVRTGRKGYVPITHAKEIYNSWWCCINNPDWQNSYYSYINEFFENTGVNGLQHDDIHFAPGWFCCGCEHCRKKFKKLFGYSLPEGLNNNAWGNFESHIWRDWILFRIISTRDELVRMRKLLGDDKALWTCCAAGINTTLGLHNAGFTPEESAKGVNVLYKEECLFPRNKSAFSWFHFYNWRRHFLERRYYQALSRAYKMPAVSLFYSETKEEHFFCWALTKSFGHSFISTNITTNSPLFSWEKIFDWERKHEKEFTQPQSIASIGVGFSYKTAAFLGCDSQYHIDEVRGWAEALIEENIPFEIVLLDTKFTNDTLKQFKLLILPNLACLDEKQISIIEGFVKNGGNIIVTHETSLYNGNGNTRKNFGFSKMFGFDYLKTVKDVNLSFYMDSMKRGHKILNNLESRIRYSGPQVLCKISRDEFKNVLGWIEKYDLFEFSPPNPAIIEKKYGEGKFIYFSPKVGLMNALEGIYSCGGIDWSKDMIGQECLKTPPVWIDERAPQYKKLLIDTIKYLNSNKIPFEFDNMPEGIVSNQYKLKNKDLIFTFLNVRGSYLKDKERIIKNAPKIFVNDKNSHEKIKVLFKKQIKSAYISSPDFNEVINLLIQKSNNRFEINIPLKLVRRFSLVCIK